jgi:phosphinothricin acetyltransferase
MVVRPARAEDLAGLTEIYNHFVVSSHVTFDVEPFTADGRREWFSHYAEDGPFRLLVAEAGGTVRGYATSSPFRTRPAYRTSVETSVYCRPDATGVGLGTRLYQRLFEGIAGLDLHRAYAGITLPNEASLALHRRFGFREVGTFREVGFKFGRYWDVLWLEKPL